MGAEGRRLGAGGWGQEAKYKGRGLGNRITQTPSDDCLKTKLTKMLVGYLKSIFLN